MTFTCLQIDWQIIIWGRCWHSGLILEFGTKKAFCSQQGEVASSKGMISFQTQAWPREVSGLVVVWQFFSFIHIQQVPIESGILSCSHELLGWVSFEMHGHILFLTSSSWASQAPSTLADRYAWAFFRLLYACRLDLMGKRSLIQYSSTPKTSPPAPG